MKVESKQNTESWNKKFEQWIPLSESTSAEMNKTRSVARGDNSIIVDYTNTVFTDVVVEDNKLVHKKDETETHLTLTIDNNSIIPGGGYHKVYYGLVNEDGETFEVTNESNKQYVDELFVTLGSKPTLGNVTVNGGKDATKTISGLTYRTKGTTRHIKLDGTTNTQYKVSSSQYYLSIDAAGKNYDVESTDKTTGFNGGYEADITLDGNDDDNGTGTITVTPHGYEDGTNCTTEILNFWGSIPTSSSTKENFGVESGDGGYRMKTPASTTVDFVSTDDVTNHEIDVNGTTCVSAVCQYGKLYHPASAKADVNQKTYSTSLPACFIRKFTGSVEPLIFKLSGLNLIQSDKVQVWWKDGDNWYDLSTPVEGYVEHSGNTITKKIHVENDESSTKDMIIAIVIKPTAKPISPITATFSR